MRLCNSGINGAQPSDRLPHSGATRRNKGLAVVLLGRLSVSSRFLLVMAIGIVLQGGSSVVSLVELRQTLTRARVSEVRHLLEVGYSIAVHYHDLAAGGAMTDAAAHDAAADALRHMHYDRGNYFFVWDLQGRGIAHGAQPALEGKTFLGRGPDAAANPVVAYMVAQLVGAAKSPTGEGLTRYRIQKAGQTEPLPKIAYSKLFAPWGWSIGTGAYLDDIEATFRARAISALGVFLALIAAAAAASYLVGRDMVGAMNRLSARAEVPDIDRHDEVGVIARALLVLRDTAREAAELRLDHLTGLPTRKLLMDRLCQIRAQGVRTGAWGALMLIDLDRFKSLNDSHGHDAGDLLLREVAQRLVACTREGDTVARLGGDEFVTVLADIGRTELEAVAVIEPICQKILAVLNQPYQLGTVLHHGSASIGATLFSGTAGAPELLLKQADLAMYKAKASGARGGGRGVCRFFDVRMETNVQERLQLERELRAAIAEEQFVLYYQPQVGVGGDIIGAETLVRWQHPDRGLLGPDLFIPLAEDTGLITPLGRWVLQAACLQLAAWAERPAMRGLKLAVNVSARQFHQADFVAGVLAVLQATGADPQHLVLELTESVQVHNLEATIDKMTDLKGEGVSFSLDDFGTGYSSLHFLKNLPINQVKIDRSFVRDLPGNENDAAIASMIVALAGTLGLKVVAEGIETVEQWACLIRLGCTYGQGFLFGRPVPLEEFERLPCFDALGVG
jgi:diguanylate cyclase (GGDEF)-like protein